MRMRDENGIYRDMTLEEIKDIKQGNARAEQADREYWQSIPYDEAVNAEIRKRYTESQEFAILRQKEEKPEEYAEYYAYREKCKADIKAKKEAAQ